jgi:hypothetical protein
VGRKVSAMMVEFAPEAVVAMRAADLLPIIMPLKADRASLRQSAERLTRRGIQVPVAGPGLFENSMLMHPTSKHSRISRLIAEIE